MRALIEDYRGWEIYFDTDREKFYTTSNEYDTQETKSSYASCKKYIDDYIKENKNFKPIEVQRLPSIFNNANKVTLIGIRKDGAFIYEEADGEKRQFSKHSEDDYFVVNEANNPIFEKMKAVAEKREQLEEQLKELEKQVVRVTVKELRKRLS